MPALVRPEPPRPAQNVKPVAVPDGGGDVEAVLGRAAHALREGLGMLPWYAPERARDRIALCDADARRLLALGALGDASDATAAARARLRTDGLGSILEDAALAPAETIARAIEAAVGEDVPLDTLAAATALLLDRQGRDGRFGPSIASTHAACTALAAVRAAYPGMHALEITAALRDAQAAVGAALGDDGLFADADRPLTATALAVEALIATGAAPLDPALRRAAKRLCAAMGADGALVERGAAAELTTAAALRALVRSRAPDWDPIDRATAFLVASLPASSGAIAEGASALAAVQAARAGRLPQQGAASESDAEFCARSLLEVSRTFARPIEMLPGDLRVAVTCGYLLCRTADTIEDNATLSIAERDLRYEAFLAVIEEGGPAERFEQLWRGVDGPPAEIELCRSLGRVMRVFRGLPREMQEKTVRWVAEMTRGMQLYSHRSPGPDGVHALFTVEDLERYCYFVAGTVGHMLTDLFLAELGEGPGVDARLLRENAESFGVGLQLVNILKDVTDDRERGWSFIPETVCAAQGIAAADLVDPEARAAAHRAVAPLFDLARGRLDRALAYTLAIPREERAVRLFCLLPLWMAARTLLHARNNDAMFVADEPVKISRTEVEQLIAECVQLCDDDEALRARYAALWSARAPMPALRGVVAN
jgi:farnesyl-diphosphate farnesyltransferase